MITFLSRNFTICKQNYVCSSSLYAETKKKKEVGQGKIHSKLKLKSLYKTKNMWL